VHINDRLYSHWIPLAGRFRPIFQLLVDEAEHQIHHAPDELHQARGHLSRGMPGSHATEVRVELHMIGERRLGISEMEECVDKALLRQDLVDDLRQSSLVHLLISSDIISQARVADLRYTVRIVISFSFPLRLLGNVAFQPHNCPRLLQGGRLWC